MNHTGIIEMRSVIQRVVTLQETFREVLTGLTKLATGTDEGLDRLSDSMERLAAAQRSILEAQQSTDDKLNTLIAVVDDLVRSARFDAVPECTQPEAPNS